MAEDEEQDVRSRSFWSGTITFGLVSVPVALYPANRRSRIALRMLSADGTPLRRRYYCPQEDRPIEREEIVRGYETSEGTYVTVTDEELEALDPEKSREIDLRRFVPVGQISPVFFDRAYFLVPSGDVTKPYLLLAETMERTGRAGIATFVLRGKEYLVAILAENGILRAETLRFQDEIRAPGEAGLETLEEADLSIVEKMMDEIRSATADKLDMEELKDFDTKRLFELIKRKSPAVRVIKGATAKDEDAEGGKVIDLMEVLKRSLQRPSAESPPDTARSEELDGQSKQALYEKAKTLNIPGRSAMSKEELARAIQEASPD